VVSFQLCNLSWSWEKNIWVCTSYSLPWHFAYSNSELFLSLSLSFSLCPSSKLSTRIALVTCSCQVLVLSIVEMGAAQSSFLSNARNDILFSAFLQDATWYSNLEETQDDPFLAGHHRIPIISHYVANILLNILNFQAMKTTTSRNFKGQESSVS
jgi:hypothetical protein